MSIKNLFKQRLFWKILLIFWLTTIATIVANIYITKQIAFNEYKTKHLREKMQTLSQEAISIYEQSGKHELRIWYRKLARQEGIRVILLRSDETPVTKLPKSVKYFKHHHYDDDDEEYEDSHEHDRPRINDHLLKLADQHVISSRGTPYILRILPSPYLRSKFNPDALHAYRLLATFLIIAIGSFWIANSIAKPIQLLRQASEKVSAGDFDTQVSSQIGRRKDELGKLALAFDNMSKEISHLLEDKKRLFTDISHEIRTPLTRQKLAIELLKADPSNQNLMLKIDQQNEEIEHLISQLLTLLKIDKAEQLELVPTDINPILERLLDNTSLEREQKNIELIAQLDSQYCVLADESYLTRAIDNILSNAIKYSPDHSQITLTTLIEEQNCIIEISDQGSGIPDSELSQILQPFYRTDKSRNSKTGGFGLGLAISSNIINKHKGKLELRNRTPTGLTVRISLPLQA